MATANKLRGVKCSKSSSYFYGFDPSLKNREIHTFKGRTLDVWHCLVWSAKTTARNKVAMCVFVIRFDRETVINLEDSGMILGDTSVSLQDTDIGIGNIYVSVLMMDTK